MKRTWLFGLLVAVLVAASSPGLAIDTNVYGDPGSDDFSVAMAVTADSAGALFVSGVFYGDFQGEVSTQWDIWMARVGPSGGFDWLLTWDAPEIHDTDFSLIDIDSPQWGNRQFEIRVGVDGVVASRFGTTVVTATTAGEDPSHQVVTADLNDLALVTDGELDVMGWTSRGTDEIGVVRLGLDGTEVWYTPVADGQVGPLTVLPDGSSFAGAVLDRLGFQTPAVRVARLSATGELTWTTDIFDACFQGSGSFVDLGGDLGLPVNPVHDSYQNLCDVDQKMVVSLDAVTGEMVHQRVLKDTLNIIWCEDPRLGIIDDAHGFGFIDGDECDGGEVYWTNMNSPLLEQGSENEAFAIAGIGTTTGDLGWGVLRTTATVDRWNLSQFEYLGPVTGMMPYDMVLTDNGPVVVGRVFNTAWIDQPAGAFANPAAQAGAATLMTSTLSPSGRFFDDNGSIFEKDIEWLDAAGITKGCNPPDNTMFCPEANVTRGQMAAFLARALNLTDDGEGDLFDDDDGSIFESAIDKLATAGITKGCNPSEGNTEFCPHDNVTRGQMAAFLVRALGYTDDGGGNLFVDDDGSIFESDIDRLATAGVTRGCNPPVNDRFCPASNVTRGQMAAFLHRALG